MLLGSQALTNDPYFNNVSLLLSARDGLIKDYSKNNHSISVFGNTTISSSQAKWGNKSIYFDGSGDYLSVPTSTVLQFETGSFTIESWIYPMANAGVIVGNNIQSSEKTFQLQVNASGKLEFLTWSTILATSSFSIVLNTWQHVSVSFNGTTYRLFINGVLNGSGTTVKNFSTSNGMTIGANNIPMTFFSGYINDLRITKGVARYTSNFTVPTQPFPNW